MRKEIVKRVVLFLVGALLVSTPVQARRVREVSLKIIPTPEQILLYYIDNDLFDGGEIALPSDRIRLVSEEFGGKRFNCTGFVMGNMQWVDIEDINLFLKFLVANHYTRICNPKEGDIVIYWSDSYELAHTGIVTRIDPDGTVWVRSKWGEGPLFDHRVDFVPEDYCPNQAVFYRSFPEGGFGPLQTIPNAFTYGGASYNLDKYETIGNWKITVRDPSLPPYFEWESGKLTGALFLTFSPDKGNGKDAGFYLILSEEHVEDGLMDVAFQSFIEEAIKRGFLSFDTSVLPDLREPNIEMMERFLRRYEQRGLISDLEVYADSSSKGGYNLRFKVVVNNSAE
ncbi:MAG: CHAP domain-containing protein [Candidatus Omnitrophica bacterium]|nr:CHAP domain-containing protein [Candidatus Omnitrophota bacterium]